METNTERKKLEAREAALEAELASRKSVSQRQADIILGVGRSDDEGDSNDPGERQAVAVREAYEARDERERFGSTSAQQAARIRGRSRGAS